MDLVESDIKAPVHRQAAGSRHIASLDCLRGVSALLVMLYHYRELLNDYIPHIGNTLFENGRIGVDIFFILSGFVMYTTTQGTNNQRVLPFLVKRAFRVVPLAWLLIIILFVAGGCLEKHAFMFSMLFVPLANENAPFYGYNILSAAWTLSYELWFYVMFAIGMAMSKSFRGLATSVVLISCVFGIQKLGHFPLNFDAYLIPIYAGKLPVPALISQLGNPLFLEFLLGIFLAYLYANFRKTWLNLNSKFRIWVYLFLAAYFLSHFFSGYAMGHGLTREGFPALAIFSLYLCADFDKSLSRVKALIRGPGDLFDFLGRISFSLYIIHDPLHQYIEAIPVLNPLYRLTGGIGKFVTLCTFSIVIAYVLYLLVERPTQRLGKFVATRLPSLARSERLSPMV
jgi:exopolysaccharide production protein ExoZ